VEKDWQLRSSYDNAIYCDNYSTIIVGNLWWHLFIVCLSDIYSHIIDIINYSHIFIDTYFLSSAIYAMFTCWNNLILCNINTYKLDYYSLIINTSFICYLSFSVKLKVATRKQYHFYWVKDIFIVWCSKYWILLVFCLLCKAEICKFKLIITPVMN